MDFDEIYFQGLWLVPTLELVTLDVRVVNLSSMLGMAPLKKKFYFHHITACLPLVFFRFA